MAGIGDILLEPPSSAPGSTERDGAGFGGFGSALDWLMIGAAAYGEAPRVPLLERSRQPIGCNPRHHVTRMVDLRPLIAEREGEGLRDLDPRASAELGGVSSMAER
jgi:hypothetical protein